MSLKMQNCNLQIKTLNQGETCFNNDICRTFANPVSKNSSKNSLLKSKTSILSQIISIKSL